MFRLKLKKVADCTRSV